MSRKPHRRTSSASRPQRGVGRWATLQSGAMLAGALGVLFLMTWQAHEVHELQRHRTELQQDVAHAQDELSRLRSTWYQTTRREIILPRAQRELALLEPGPDEREVVAVRWGAPAVDAPGLFDRLREGLDRYGEVRGAQAEENRP